MSACWYRRVDAIARYPDRRGALRTVRLSHEEPLGTDYDEHVGQVAKLLTECGINDDMGDGSSITFHVTYRCERP